LRFLSEFCLLQVFQSLIFGSQVKDKHHLHSIHVASYLDHGSEGEVQAKE
jgi:hypothetical protein